MRVNNEPSIALLEGIQPEEDRGSRGRVEGAKGRS